MLGHRVSRPFCEGQRGGRCRTGLRAAGAEAGGALTRSRRRVAPPRHGDYLRRRFPRRTPDSRISHQHTTIPAREAERNGHRECSARSANGSRVDMRSHQQTPPLASATNACPLRMHCILRSWPAMTDVPPSQTCPRWDSNPHCLGFESSSSASWDTRASSFSRIPTIEDAPRSLIGRATATM